MNNRKKYSKHIIKRAFKVLKHPELGLNLVKETTEVLSSRAKLSAKINGVKNQLFVFGRLLKAYTKGHYRDIPFKSMLYITGVLVYFVTPMDLIPDFIPISGYLDDATLILWLYNHLSVELQHFLVWESKQKEITTE